MAAVRTYPSDIKDEEWALYQPWTRWRDVRVFGAIVYDLNALQRRLLECPATPSAIVLDGHTLQSTPESGHRAGWDGANACAWSSRRPTSRSGRKC